MELVDLSLTGLRCTRSRHLELGQDRKVHLKVSVDDAEFAVPAIVVRIDDDEVSDDIGLTFDGVDPATLQILQQLLSES